MLGGRDYPYAVRTQPDRDITHQSYAVERALKAFEAALLEGHLGSCVPTGFKEGRDREMIRELSELFQLSRK
jgi:DNA-binding FrmR family transcriptional regulator